MSAVDPLVIDSQIEDKKVLGNLERWKEQINFIFSKIHIGSSSPQNAETGNVGDIFLRTDGGASTTLYVKESGSATNTGWVAK